MKKQIFLFYIIGLILCVSISCTRSNTENKNTDNSVEEVNNNHLINATLWVKLSQEYKANCYQAFNLAKMALDKNLETASKEKPAGVILDIDETVLDNSEFQARLIKNNIAYNSNLWTEWVNEAIAKPIPGAIEFLNYAKSKNVEVLYITNRKTIEEKATIKNMKELGFPNTSENYEKYFKFKMPSDTGKESRRQEYLKTYDIILYIGDNLADFEKIYEENNRNNQDATASRIKEYLGTKYIILPNPMYGDWETKEIKENRIEALK